MVVGDGGDVGDVYVVLQDYYVWIFYVVDDGM